MILILNCFAGAVVVPNNVLIGAPSEFDFTIGNFVSVGNGEGYLQCFSKNLTKTFVFNATQISLQQNNNVYTSKYYIFFAKIQGTAKISVGFQATLQNGYYLVDQSKQLIGAYSTIIDTSLILRVPMLTSKIYQLTVFISKVDGVRYFNTENAYNFTRKVPTYFSTSRDICALPKNFQPKENKNYYYGIFYQIIQYTGKKVLWLAVYSQKKTGQSFSNLGWMGILYGSKSIVDNDCTLIQYKFIKQGFFSSATVLDTRIFGGGMPYQDTNKLLNATSDIYYSYSSTSEFNFLLSNRISGQGSSGKLQSFLVSFYRYFNTNDVIGDVQIKQKANYQICIAFNMQSKSKEEVVQCFYINTIAAMHFILYFYLSTLLL